MRQQCLLRVEVEIQIGLGGTDEREKKRVKQLEEIEISKSIILGSMLRKDEIHPLDNDG